MAGCFRATLMQICKLLFPAFNQRNSITCVDLACNCTSKFNSHDQKRISSSKMCNAQPSHAMSLPNITFANYDIFRCAYWRKNRKRIAFYSFVHQCSGWKLVSKRQFHRPAFFGKIYLQLSSSTQVALFWLKEEKARISTPHLNQ